MNPLKAAVEENARVDKHLGKPAQKQQESRKSKYLGSIKEESLGNSRNEVTAKPESATYFKSKPTRKLRFITKRETSDSDDVKESARSALSFDHPVVDLPDHEYSDALVAID